ncbi:class I SAM-dependent methyltransferase, partial [bacterium]
MSATVQYDDIRKEYVALAATEPSKQFVQYPEILRLLGDVKGQKILDVGCGPGLLTRQIAARGAEVTAYDNSAEQIQLALEEENAHPLGIRYLIADANSIEKESGLPPAYFDSAISTLVLHYAKDLAELEQFFSSTFRLLKEDSRFITIICNPDYTRMD